MSGDFNAEGSIVELMGRDAVIARLKEAEAELRARGVTHAALFGSVARGEERLDSDIDILIEISAEAHNNMDVYSYTSIVHVIEDLFTIHVDVSNRISLKDHVRPSAERDAIYAF